MAKVLISPGKYVQGAGEMKKLGEYAQNYGKKALILISKGGYKRIGAMVEKSFEGKECGYTQYRAKVNEKRSGCDVNCI